MTDDSIGVTPELLYLDQSECAKLLRSAPKNTEQEPELPATDLGRIRASLSMRSRPKWPESASGNGPANIGFMETRNKFEKWEKDCDSGLLSAIIELLKECEKTSPESENLLEICKSIDSEYSTSKDATNYSKLVFSGEHPALTAFDNIEEAEFQKCPIGCGVVFDLLARWFNHEEPTRFAATTKILSGHQSSTGVSGVLNFDVELFPVSGGGPLCPDPCYLGLTSIDSNVKASIEKIWDVAGLSASYRGRWRLRNVNENERIPNTVESYQSSFTGNSFEIGALCAVLAASGNPYQSKGVTPDRAEPIDSTVVISACLHKDEAVTQEKDLMQRSLGAVASHAEKLTHAITHKLSTVFFSAEEISDRESDESFANIRGILSEQDEDVEYAGLRVYGLETVQEAIDSLLLTNRHLAAYQGKVRELWLGQWDEGTADFNFGGPE